MAISFGKIAYDAYRDKSGGKSLVSGEPIPVWPELPETIRMAWEAAGDAVAEDCEDACSYYSQEDDTTPEQSEGAIECMERIRERRRTSQPKNPK